MMVILQPADIAISGPVHSGDLSIRSSRFQGKKCGQMKCSNGSVRSEAEAASYPGGMTRSEKVKTVVRMEIGMEVRNR